MKRNCVGIGALRIQVGFRRSPFLTVIVICSDSRIMISLLCHGVDEPVSTVINISGMFAYFSGDMREKERGRELK